MAFLDAFRGAGGPSIHPNVISIGRTKPAQIIIQHAGNGMANPGDCRPLCPGRDPWFQGSPPFLPAT